MDLRKLTVLIAGRKYKFTSVQDVRQVERMAALVNRCVDEARLQSPGADRETIITAAALTLAQELLSAQDDNQHLRVVRSSGT